jgi:hypothetical protein
LKVLTTHPCQPRPPPTRKANPRAGQQVNRSWQLKKREKIIRPQTPTFAPAMKKYLLIFLAFQILATSSPSNQGVQTLFKIGSFFHHFAQHLISHQEKIGIVDFVKLHYSGHKHHEEDHDAHENLPFHHHHDQQNLAPQTPCLLPPHHAVVAFPKLEIISNPLISQSQQWLASAHLRDIWQPPKA